ncbi:MAG: hypothetical protein P4L73_00085 [Caulobacteraceae bacterium]|nr:hypothetical protein [Caulobacteraceae bacterium]
MGSFEFWQLVVMSIQAGLMLATLLVAAAIGARQNEINGRLQQLQDFVAISVTPGDSQILLKNTGKVNLYLWGFYFPGNHHKFNRPRLIAAGSPDSAFYWLPAPSINAIHGTEFELKLYLTDEFDHKWIADAGGEVTILPAQPATTAPKARRTKAAPSAAPPLQTAIMKVWSYRTYRDNWTL